MKKPEIYSYSKLTSWHQCEYGYKLNYYDNVENKQNWFGSIGSLTHSIIESYLHGEVEKSDMAEMYKSGAELINEKPPFPALNKWHNELYAYFLTFKGFSTKVLGVEEELYIYFPKQNYWFRGYIDMYGQNSNGGYDIIDHKVSDPNGKSWDTEEKIKQLYLYSMYIFIKHGQFPQRLIFNFPRKKTHIIEGFNMNTFKKHTQWMHDTVELIRKAKNQEEYLYEAKPDKFFCEHICGVRESCEVFNNDALNKLKSKLG